MQSITMIGLDIAKSVFQVHGVDAEDNVILRRQLKRRYAPVWLSALRRFSKFGFTGNAVDPASALSSSWPISDLTTTR